MAIKVSRTDKQKVDMKRMLVDSHTHIQLKQFRNDRDLVISRAEEAGVGCIIAVGFDLESSKASLKLAEQYDFIYATVGMHPHDAKLLNDEVLDDFRRLAKHPKVIALGEMGLDYYRNLSPHKKQRDAFESQLLLAQELNLPVIIHDRDAHDAIMQVLRQHSKNTHGILHCFSGNLSMAEEAIALGFYISIAGPVTYRNSHSLQEVARKIPLDRLLIETDCPWLVPQQYRRKRIKRNEPAYVKAVAEKIAVLRDVPLTAIAEATTINAERLFGMLCH